MDRASQPGWRQGDGGQGDGRTARRRGALFPGNLSADQVLLAALLCLLVREEADPLLILAVAYILIG